VNILAIDTSTEACSVALSRSDGVTFSQFEIAPRQHTRLLPEMMNRVLRDAEISKSMISHCAFTNGPGAFTGIRIGVAQAQGLGLALGVPLVPVSTLAVLAQVCLDQTRCNKILVALDARMQEIYWANYERAPDDSARLAGLEMLSGVDAVEIDDDIDYGAGHGWLEALQSRAGFPVDSSLLPNARALISLAQNSINQNLVVDARQVRINYLRNRVAEKAKV
jgi:tRNA threonylcarbamoyladenosine biosynthesis protein TsaB